MNALITGAPPFISFFKTNMMAELKRRTLILSSKRQIKLYGSSMAISSSLEIGEGAAPNIFSCIEQQVEDSLLSGGTSELSENNTGKQRHVKKTSMQIVNPYHLTETEILEIADYNIRLWMDLKDNIRKYGMNNPKVFNVETVR